MRAIEGTVTQVGDDEVWVKTQSQAIRLDWVDAHQQVQVGHRIRAAIQPMARKGGEMMIKAENLDSGEKISRYSEQASSTYIFFAPWAQLPTVGVATIILLCLPVLNFLIGISTLGTAIGSALSHKWGWRSVFFGVLAFLGSIFLGYLVWASKSEQYSGWALFFVGYSPSIGSLTYMVLIAKQEQDLISRLSRNANEVLQQPLASM
jgi:hypothetical protein